MRRILGTGITALVGLLGLPLQGCGGGGGGPRVAGAAARSLGPSGGTIRGPAGTRLEGLEIVVPKGALARFHSFRLEGADPPAMKDAAPIGEAFRLRVVPDPGRLALPLEIRVRVAPPRFRKADDVLLLRETPLDPGAPGSGASVFVPERSSGGLDGRRRFYRATSRRFGLFVPVVSRVPRRRTDAAALTGRGLLLLQRLDDAAIREAAAVFRDALSADPFDVPSRFLAALSRLCLLLNDRRDSGPGIDSLGEWISSFGYPLRDRSLLRLAVSGRWPGRWTVPPKAPRAAASLDFFRRKVLPELSEIDRMFAAVGEDLELPVPLAGDFRVFGVRRELDTADLFALRAGLHMLRAVVLWAGSYDFEADPRDFEALGRDGDPESFLKVHPRFGTRLRAADPSALRETIAALGFGLEAFRALRMERDDQRDDVLVIRSSVSEAKRDFWQNLLASSIEALQGDGVLTLRFRGQPGTLAVRPSVFFDSGRFVPRSLAPLLQAWLPVASGSFDPTLGGLFPGLFQDEAIRRAGLATKATLVSADITVDGSFLDWPTAAEILKPDDYPGDARGQGFLAGIDGRRLFAAISKREFFVRLDLEDGSPGFRPTQATLYRILGHDLGRRRTKNASFEIRVDTSTSPPAAALFVSGGPKIPCSLGLGKKGFEVGVPLIAMRQFLGVGRTPRPRMLSFKIQAFDRKRGLRGGDESRPVVLTF